MKKKIVPECNLDIDCYNCKYFSIETTSLSEGDLKALYGCSNEKYRKDSSC